MFFGFSKVNVNIDIYLGSRKACSGAVLFKLATQIHNKEVEVGLLVLTFIIQNILNCGYHTD